MLCKLLLILFAAAFGSVTPENNMSSANNFGFEVRLFYGLSIKPWGTPAWISMQEDHCSSSMGLNNFYINGGVTYNVGFIYKWVGNSIKC